MTHEAMQECEFTGLTVLLKKPRHSSGAQTMTIGIKTYLELKGLITMYKTSPESVQGFFLSPTFYVFQRRAATALIASFRKKQCIIKAKTQNHVPEVPTSHFHPEDIFTFI